MANEEREIRFIDPMYNEKFRIPDGGKIRVEYSEYPDWDYTATCKYIDDYHTSINNRVFHICEFAELMERNNCKVRPEVEWEKEAEEAEITVLVVEPGKEPEVRTITDSLESLQGQVGSFDIYQLKDSPETKGLQFESYRQLTQSGQTVSKANYMRVYSGTLYTGENLDSIYERFNLQHPSDFRGHSLSVSDVIVLHQNGQDQAFYVDSFGFQQVPEFFSDNPLKTVEELLEDDYGMIDGIINNGDRRQDSEEKKEKSSVREKLQEKKKEAAEAEASRPKLPKKSKDMDVDLS